MRPPAMQTTALQQNNEVHINTQRQRQLQQQQLQPTQHHQLPLQLRPPQYQQQQQQQQQLQLQLQLQQQPQTTSVTLLNHSSYDTAATTASQQARKYRFEQPDFTVDKPLNFVATTTAAATTDEVTIAAPKLNGRRSSAAYPATVRLPVDDKTRQQQFVQQQHFHHQQQPQHTSLDCMQLLDLSTSPPHEPIYPLQGSISTYLPQRPLADVPPPYRRASAASVAPVQTHRASYASQYSRSSSSEDGSIGGSNAVHFPKTYSRASSAFDDAAEHFIINFPAADSPLHNQNDCVINLPLSETEPLLTNIEATVSDKQRSIRLPKSSASLIFTKKDLLAQRTASIAPYHTANTNNNCATQQHQQQQPEQEKRNQPKQQQQQQQQQLHQSLNLRSANEYATRKPVKHLPASYQQQQPHPQQQRRSLQLNYNNNLVTTSTCCSANNNYCRTTTGKSASGSDASSVGGSIGAVLHKHHHASGGQNLKAATPAATTTVNVIPQQHQHKNQQQLQSGQNNTNTAAATRKQHAYSWYAPVYSALEEELEQDSRDSSPIHNLANTKKQHLNHYQHHRPTHNSSTAVDNETVALLETRNQVNIQAQLHAQANSNAHPGKDIIVGGGGVGGGTVRAQQKHSGQAARRTNGQAPSTLPLANAHNALLQSEMAASESGGGGVGLSSNTEHTSAPVNGYETDGGLVNSLSGTLPPRRRIENFLKSLVGRKSSSSARNSGNSGNGGNAEVVASVTMTSRIDNVVSQQPMPASPEITITGTPSEQNLVLLRDTSLLSGQYKQPLAATQEQRKSECGSDKLTANGAIQGSTSSLNVVQQKLWNMMRREGSAASLYNEKSHSIVQYRGLRKCETVLALTRQTNSLCSPVFGGSAAAHVGASEKNGGGGSGVARHNSCSAGGGAGGGSSSGMRRTHTTGSGIFSASGVEQIRPLNRLRNSISSVNAAATCSRCSSLLSLAASGSRYSLNVTSNGGGGLFVQAPTVQMPTSASQHQLQALAAHLDCKPPPHSSQQHQQQRERKISNVSSSQLNNNCNVLVSNRNADPNAAEQIASGGGNSSGNCSRKSSAGAPSTHSASSITPPSNMTTATLTSSITSPHDSTPTTPTATAIATTASVVAPEALVVTPTANVPHLQTAMSSYESTSNSNTSGILVDLPSSPTSATSSASTPCTSASCSSANTPAPTYALPTISQTYPFTITSLLAMSKTAMARDGGRYSGSGEQDDDNAMTISMPSACKGTTHTDMSVMDGRDFVSYMATPAPVATQPAKHFEPFTCKLCLVDVEAKEEATTLQQCGCEFCTECMKAYVDFEITEGAYEISCPDAQCPAQGIMTLPEIANLTTTNLMKKHHRYRLNKEIEMDKTRTWCPRAGCETVCLVGTGPHSDATPSTSTGSGGGGGIPTAAFTDSHGTQQNLCAVQCPSCKDEFCSACKKAWHPNMTCEENSRRLVADGQDDIGIPFDNDLIKCCPMCAVPIEKDEGCAQMMCKRCKHVFCWYCLASLDDDFLLRHYDRGPCKNKLGHSRASVVWHRAQVIGIFAGFGILLLVASPLLLLAAPCIICCKCRSCSGARIDEGDAELDEATALQSL